MVSHPEFHRFSNYKNFRTEVEQLLSFSGRKMEACYAQKACQRESHFDKLSNRLGESSHLENDSTNSEGQMTHHPRKLALVSTRAGRCEPHDWGPFSADWQGYRRTWREVWVGHLKEAIDGSGKVVNEQWKATNNTCFSLFPQDPKVLTGLYFSKCWQKQITGN